MILKTCSCETSKKAHMPTNVLFCFSCVTILMSLIGGEKNISQQRI